MRTIITVYFPEQNTYSPERVIKYHSTPTQVAVNARPPTDFETSLYSQQNMSLVIDNVVFMELVAIMALQRGGVYIIYQNEFVYKVIGVTTKKENNTIRLFCAEANSVELSEFNSLKADSEQLVAGDDRLGV